LAPAKLDAAITWPLRRTGRHHDEIRIAARVDVVAALDPTTTNELQAVAEVERLGPGAGAVDVVQRDLVGEAVMVAA